MKLRPRVIYMYSVENMGVFRGATRIIAVPVTVAGGAVNAAGEASTAVVVGTTNAVNGLIDGASGAGVSVIKGARRAASGVTAAAKKLLERTGKAANGALGMKGGRRNRTNRNRRNKNRTNRNRRNRN